MQTIKTGVVVTLLLAVCYGAFVALNAPEPELPASIAEWVNSEDDLQQLLAEDFQLDIAAMEPNASSSTLAGQSQPSGFPSNDQFSQQNMTSIPPLDTSNLSGGFGSLPTNSGAMPNQLASSQSGMGNQSNSQESMSLIPDLPSSPATSSPATGSGLRSSTQSQPPFSNSGSAPAQGMASLASSTSASAPQLETPELGGFPELGDPTLSMPSFSHGAASGQGIASTGLPSISDAMGKAKNDLVSMATEVKQDLTSTAEDAQASLANAAAEMLPTLEFSVAKTQALQMARGGQVREALAMMTEYYRSPELGSTESNDLIDMLDGLAREVIYSNRHWLEPARIVKATDTVASVAAEYNIAPELLNAVNGLGDAKALVPGSELKVVRGPINARVDLSDKELTLFVGDLYAGRFPISIGNDPSPKEGAFEVVDRQRNRTYYGANQLVLKDDDPMNPYGGYWLNLGDLLCIHGTAERLSPDLENAGCISLAPLDASHVYSILTVGSQVKIAQ